MTFKMVKPDLVAELAPPDQRRSALSPVLLLHLLSFACCPAYAMVKPQPPTSCCGRLSRGTGDAATPVAPFCAALAATPPRAMSYMTLWCAVLLHCLVSCAATGFLPAGADPGSIPRRLSDSLTFFPAEAEHTAWRHESVHEIGDDRNVMEASNTQGEAEHGADDRAAPKPSNIEPTTPANPSVNPSGKS